MDVDRGVKKLIWAGLLAGVGALANLAAVKLAAALWRRVYDEEPPE